MHNLEKETAEKKAQKRKRGWQAWSKASNLIWLILFSGFSGFFFCNFFNCSLPARINSLLITRRSNMIYLLRGRKDPLKFASLPTCGFVAQLVERPTSIWEARVQAPSKPEFFSGFFFCNFFNCSLPARINSLLITRRSNMIYFIYYLWWLILLVWTLAR